MTRAELPNPSARAEWLLAGGPGDHDHDHPDSETDTAIPDDDDIASLASQSFASLQPSALSPPCDDFSK